MNTNTFYLDYNVTGAERKRLVKAISDFTGADAKYLGAPTFSYMVDYFTIDRNGVVSFDDRADSEEIESLIDTLVNEGFVSQVSDLGCRDEDDEPAAEPVEPEVDGDAAESETLGLTVRIPLERVAVGNLTNLLQAKGNLIRSALGIDSLPIEVEPDAVAFPWFRALPEPDEVKAYTHLIAALCEMSKNQKRITATEKEVDNEKYAFRCFLLRLGFIGSEFKGERKILLRNLSGSSAFKSGQRKTETPKPQPPIPAVDWDAENREDALYIAAVNAEMDAQVPGGDSDAVSE